MSLKAYISRGYHASPSRFFLYASGDLFFLVAITILLATKHLVPAALTALLYFATFIVMSEVNALRDMVRDMDGIAPTDPDKQDFDPDNQPEDEEQDEEEN